MYVHDIGSSVQVIEGINPANAAAGTTNGTSRDRAGLGGDVKQSCVLRLACGAVTGAPSAQSVQVTLQDSADASSWANVTVDGVLQQSTALVADNTQAELNIRLLGVRRYVRAVVVVAFTGGTSPAIPVMCEFVFGGALKKPA